MYEIRVLVAVHVTFPVEMFEFFRRYSCSQVDRARSSIIRGLIRLERLRCDPVPVPVQHSVPVSRRCQFCDAGPHYLAQRRFTRRTIAPTITGEERYARFGRAPSA